jgi:hypothetical protein
MPCTDARGSYYFSSAQEGTLSRSLSGIACERKKEPPPCLWLGRGFDSDGLDVEADQSLAAWGVQPIKTTIMYFDRFHYMTL